MSSVSESSAEKSEVASKVQGLLRGKTYRWLVTGGAGFIGSHLVETLLGLDQEVVVVDNYSTGSRSNLDDLLSRVPAHQQKLLTLKEGDIRESEVCSSALNGCQFVLHQAALGSVPRSIERPQESHAANLTGFLNMIESAKLQQGSQDGLKAFVYASSSSVYGDSPELPKRESVIGNPLSPYAVTKLGNELYATAYCERCTFPIIGLRYFNVFGPRQNPQGPYAAVIPRWIETLSKGDAATIYGDGETSRDFCYVENVVYANLLAALRPPRAPSASVYNVACGSQTTLKELHDLIAHECQQQLGAEEMPQAIFEDFRDGDIRHSLASLTMIQEELHYEPLVNVKEGIRRTVARFS